MATIIRKGKPVEIDDQILRWRRKMRRFRKLKLNLIGLLLDRLGSAKAVEAWLNTPLEGLSGAKPRQFVNPKQVTGLIKWVKSNVHYHDTKSK